MTKYEVTKILSARVQQLSDGAASVLRDDHPARAGCLLQIAIAELEEGVVPMMIRRDLPDGQHEVWRVRELRLPRAFMRHAKAIRIM